MEIIQKVSRFFRVEEKGHSTVLPDKLLFLSGVFFSLLFLGIVFLRGYRPTATTWAWTFWLINYQDEFLKRGFVGEITRLLSVYPTREIVNRLSNYLTGAVTIVMTIVFLGPMIKKRTLGLWLFFLLCISQSSTMQHFSYLSGFLDSFLLLLLIFILLAIASTPKHVAFCISIFLLGISILIHEGAVFLILPVALTYYVYKFSESRRDVLICVSGGMALLLLTVMVSALGNATIYSYDEYLARLRSEYGESVNHWALRVLYNDFQSSLREVLGFYLGRFRHQYNEHLALAIFHIPLAIIMFRVFRNCIKANPKLCLVLGTAFISPLLILPIGHDTFRWFSFSITNFLMVCSFIAMEDEVFLDQLNLTMISQKELVWISIVLSLIAGPTGWYAGSGASERAFPMFLLGGK